MLTDVAPGAMPTSVDALSWRGRVFPLILALRERSPMTAKEFEHESGVSQETAQELRDLMLAEGLIREEVRARRGATATLAITLTPLGARAAVPLAEFDRVLREDDDAQSSG